MNWYELLNTAVQRSADIATVIGVISVIMAVFTYRKTVRYRSQDDEIRLVENSIKVMGIFNDICIPQMATYQKRFEADFALRKRNSIKDGQHKMQNSSAFPMNISLEHQLRQQAQLTANVGSIFEKLEQLCTYIIHDMTMDSIVYADLHLLFMDFIQNNKDSLNALTTADRPFTGIHLTYERWHNRSERDRIDSAQAYSHTKAGIL